MSAAKQLLWRTDDPVLDDRGSVVRGGMFQHQRDWWNLPNFVRGLVTGYGGGKTLSLGKRAIWMALLNSPVPFATCSPSYPMAKNTIVPTIEELLDGKCSLHPTMRFRLIQSQPYQFRIWDRGSEAKILCMSGERPERLKGSNLCGAGIDEPFIQDRAVFEQMLARVRHPMAKHLEIDLTGTPEGVVGWGFDLFEGELRERYDVGLVQAGSEQNLALPPGYVDRMNTAYDDNAREAYVKGRFVNMATGRVYHSFDSGLHVVDAAQPKDAELCVGMDFNVDPLAFVVFWHLGQRMHVVAEHELRNADAEQAAIEIRRLYPNVRRVYPDASGHNRQHAGAGGKSAFGYLQDHGFVVCARPQNPLVPDRWNAVNGGLRHGRVTIAPGCRKLKTYLLAYTHAESNKTTQKAMSHLLDAFGYPIAFLFPVDRNAMRLVSYRQ